MRTGQLPFTCRKTHEADDDNAHILTCEWAADSITTFGFGPERNILGL